MPGTRRVRRLAPVALATLSIAAPAQAAEPIMPLAQVHAGMRCTALSVIQGTVPTSFDVDVLDVVAGDAGMGARLLVRVSGRAVDATGIGPGFSGSPISCTDDQGASRVVAAISESVGEYGNHVALATPIESVLGQPVDPPAGARRDGALLRAARPLRGPVSIGGLSAPVARGLQAAAARAGRVLYTAPARPRASAFPQQQLVPGSAMAVGLASGDITVGAVGTVTYVDGDRLWAFGHPLDAAGRRSLFLQDAYVYAVVDNPLAVGEVQTYKLAVPGHDLGTLTSDGIDAVAGRVGALPPSFPLTVTARDLDTGLLRVTRQRIADESAVGEPTGASALGLIGPAAASQTAYDVLGGFPSRVSGNMCVRIALAERSKPLGFCNTYVSATSIGGDAGALSMPAGAQVADVTEAVRQLDAFKFGPLHVTGVQVGMRLRRGLSQAYLTGVRGPSVVHRGHDVRVRMTFRRVNGSATTRTMSVHVPHATRKGLAVLTLTGTPADAGDAGSVLELLLGGGDGGDAGGAADEPGPPTVGALAQSISAIHRDDGVAASIEPLGARRPSGTRRVYRDPALRISGKATMVLDVRR